MSRIEGSLDWEKYENPIGTPTFYKGFTQSILDAVLASPSVTTKIHSIADELGVSGNTVTRRAENLAKSFVARQESKAFIRFARWSVSEIMSRVYDQGIFIDAVEIENLRETARLAQSNNQSLIFLPCHRSHIDYVSLHLILFQIGISLPSIVAGENLNFPIVGPFLQSAGAFWIPREWEAADPLYTTLLSAYIDVLLARGLNLECFIEGGRSRTGKMLPPKFGMLKILVESLVRQNLDAIIVPVSIQYDNVLETESYANELLGTPKTKESLSSFLKARRVLGLRMGRIDARFAKGFSVKDCLSVLSIQDGPEGIGGKGTVKKLRALGYKILNEINDVSVVMPTALVGTILLTIRGRGIGAEELVRRVSWLTSTIKSKGSRVASIENYESVVRSAISVLGPLVGVRKGLLEDTYYAADRFRLSYFRNQIIHLFISECIICVSLYTRVKQGGTVIQQAMSLDDLRDQTGFLSQVMKGEFIYNTLGLDSNMDSALMRLCSDQVLVMEGDSVNIHPSERLGGRENYDFYCFLIWPFIETYWFAGVSLFALTPPSPSPASVPSSPSASDDLITEIKNDHSILYREFSKRCEILGKTLFYQGDLSYITAISRDTLTNALNYYHSLHIIIISKSTKRADRKISLAGPWEPNRGGKGELLGEGRLWEFVEKIAISRREGKNRRDNATVAKRVVGLVDRIGREMATLSAGKSKL